jgi:galactokinase
MSRPPAVAAFERLTGSSPHGVWTAPGRVNLIGEHTDYNQGLVLPFAIEASTDVAAARRDDGVLRVLSLQRPGEVIEVAASSVSPTTVDAWSTYPLGVVWAFREEGYDVGGADLVIDGRVPLGSGLSSSASLECAVALAICELHGLDLPGERLAQLAQRAENDVVGAPTGPMDQRASLLCTRGHALLLDTRDMSTEQVPLDPGAAGLALLVVDSRVHHKHAENAYGARKRACEQACAQLGVRALRDVSAERLSQSLALLDGDQLRRRVRHVVTEDARTRAIVQALGTGDWSATGEAMTASHASLRDDYEVSCPELDVLVAAALDAGALGARMTGGGFGGCAVVLARTVDVDAVTATVCASFRAHGYDEPRAFLAHPSAGARRLDGNGE